MSSSVNPAFVVITYVYQEIWNSTVGEQLICKRETLNPTDRYAVAVISKL